VKTQPLIPDVVAEIEDLWRTHIPLSVPLGVHIVRIDERGVEVAAPLPPNRNHLGTGFAGSLLAVASLSGWATVVVMLGGTANADVVVQETSASFFEPVTGELRALGFAPDVQEREQFLHAYRRRGRARIGIVVEIVQDGRVVMRAESRFVATRRSVPRA
jgi:thioesterase domain-containing protein